MKVKIIGRGISYTIESMPVENAMNLVEEWQYGSVKVLTFQMGEGMVYVARKSVRTIEVDPEDPGW